MKPWSLRDRLDAAYYAHLYGDYEGAKKILRRLAYLVTYEEEEYHVDAESRQSTKYRQ